MKRLGSVREMSSRMMLAGVLTLTLGVVALAGTAPAARFPDRPPMHGRYIVVFKDSVDHPEDVARSQTARHNGELGFVYRYVLRGYSAHLPEQAIAAIARDPRVAYIEPDSRIRAAAQTVPTGIRRTFASSNPYLGINGIEDLQANVDVAVIDQGVEYHADLNVFRRTNCFYARRATECIEGSVAPGPHGTHVAGIIGAKDNSFGVTGIAPGARLWSIQVLDPYTNEGWLAGYIAAIEWVTLHAGDIEVANSSIRYESTYEAALTTAMENSIRAGVVHVVAAGNQREPVGHVPANIPDVITVSAIADYDGRPGEATFFIPYECQYVYEGFDDRTYTRSNYGWRVDIAAPGVCIYSTLPNGQYGYDSGTSMAAPYVAGAAALLATRFNPNSRNDVLGIREILVQEGNFGWTDDSGDGIQEPLLDVRNAWYFWLGSSTQTEPPSEYTPTPTGTTGTASNATTSAATLNGTVNPHGASAQYYFEYGLTRDYGTRMPSRSFPSGIYSTQAVSQAISGLQPNTTYHLRLVASSAGGTIEGADESFTTPSWTIQTTPNVAEASDSYFFAVGCEPSSTNLCTAVGKSTSSSLVDSPMAQRWDGTRWSFQTPALKSGATETRLLGVDCPSTIRCIAVGNYQVSGSGSATLAELWNEGRWSVQSAPVPANATSSELTDVGCNSTAECVAVGSGILSNVRTAILERWQSPTWTLQTVPIPAGAASSELRGVDCLWSNFCVAVGQYVTSGGSTRSLAMFWNGNWSLQTLAEPAEATATILNDVSCTASPNACTVVGTWKNANDGNRVSTLAYRFNGSSWTRQSTPNPSGSSASYFLDVSCATPTSCTAAGSWSNGGYNKTLAAHWNGSSWSLQGTPDPSGAVHSWLVGASCRLTRCIAVGYSRDSQEIWGVNSTLGEIR